MPTDMNIWRNLVKQRVESIADEQYQRHEWFDNAKNTWFFPEEMFCKFFDDAAAEDFFNRNDTGLNAQQLNTGKHLVSLMKQLSDQIPKTKSGIDPARLINDPLMIKCREAAKEFLALLG
jgi:hypothetical protein